MHSAPGSPHIPLMVDVSALSAQLPQDDQAALELLHDAVAIAEWASSRVEEYQRRICILFSIRNETLPVYRLPTEIMLKILEDPCFTPEGRIQLRGVCRRWQSIIHSTSKLWASLIETTKLNGFNWRHNVMLAVCLARSGDLALQNISMVPFVGPAFPKHLASHRHRFTSLTVQLQSQQYYRKMQETISTGMHNLRSLNINEEMSKPIDTTAWPPLICRQDLLPRLEELKMPVDLFCRSIIVASLRTIELCGKIPYLDTLVDTLTQCPRLQALSLSVSECLLQGNRDHKVDLPFLREITSHCDGPTTATLLTRITFPPTTAIRLSNIGGIEDAAIAIPPDSPVFRKEAQIDRLLVSCDTYQVSSIRYGSMDTERLCVNFKSRSWREHDDAAFWTLLRDTSRITTLSIVTEDSCANSGRVMPGWQTMLNVFSCLHTLQLSAHGDIGLACHWSQCRHAIGFLEKQGDERGLNDLTVAWQVVEQINPNSRATTWPELQNLEQSLRERQSKGKARLRTLRLHRSKRDSSAPPTMHVAVTADGDPSGSRSGDFDDIVSRLRELVGNVVVTDTPIHVYWQQARADSA